jgi:peptidoglycan hydrolase CwlO-like protein
MAQDFYAAFGVGEDNKHITTVDEEGVALAAIQGLSQKVNEKDAEIQEQGAEIQDLKARLQKLEQSLGTKSGGGK